MSHISASLLYCEVAAGVFEQYERPSNVWICIFQKMEILRKIWSKFEIDLRPKNLRALKKHSGRVFPINNIHPVWTDPLLLCHRRNW